MTEIEELRFENFIEEYERLASELDVNTLYYIEEFADLT
jgi:hypothetical protein